jgi:hypothetical protein
MESELSRGITQEFQFRAVARRVLSHAVDGFRHVFIQPVLTAIIADQAGYVLDYHRRFTSGESDGRHARRELSGFANRAGHRVLLSV